MQLDENVYVGCSPNSGCVSVGGRSTNELHGVDLPQRTGDR